MEVQKTRQHFLPEEVKSWVGSQRMKRGPTDREQWWWVWEMGKTAGGTAVERCRERRQDF